MNTEQNSPAVAAPLDATVRRSYALNDPEVRKLKRLSAYVSTLKEAKEMIDTFTTAEAAIAYLDAKWALETEKALQQALRM